MSMFDTQRDAKHNETEINGKYQRKERTTDDDVMNYSNINYIYI